MATSRARKRQALTSAQNRYDAAGTGRRIARWNPPSTGPVRAVEGVERMRNRARDSIRNDWAGESGSQKWTTTLIGTGIQPRFKNPKHRALWDEFVPQADADGVLDAYGMQALGVRSWFSGGEAFERRRPRPLNAPLNVPVQVQLIESDFLPYLDTKSYPGLPEGHEITQGIERNRFGRRTAYWFWREHPGDGRPSPRGDQLVRVSASEVRHIFEPQRPGQLRGVSPLAPVLLRLRNSADFEDAVLDRQKLANLYTMFVTRALPPDADIDYDPTTGLPVWYGKDGNPLVGLEPGISQELQPGEDVKFANPPEAGVSYPDYVRTNYLGTASGLGVPYEFLSGDLRDVSDRALRVLVNEFRRFAQQRQWHLVIPMICQPMVEWCMDAAVLAGKLPLSEYDEARRPEWRPHGWEYMHPVQDAQGKQILHDLGVLSKSDIIAERGDDPEAVFQQRADDQAAEDKLGLTPPEPQPGATGGAGQQQQQAMQRTLDELLLAQARAPSPAPAPAPPDPIMLSLVQALQQQHSALVALAERVATLREPATVNVGGATVNLPEPVINVAAPIVNLPEPVINVAAPIVNLPETVVNVAAPVIHNDVTVPAPEVTVSLPDRQITSEIERDRSGNIVNVTQTETTLQ